MSISDYRYKRGERRGFKPQRTAEEDEACRIRASELNRKWPAEPAPEIPLRWIYTKTEEAG